MRERKLYRSLVSLKDYTDSNVDLMKFTITDNGLVYENGIDNTKEILDFYINTNAQDFSNISQYSLNSKNASLINAINHLPNEYKESYAQNFKLETRNLNPVISVPTENIVTEVGVKVEYLENIEVTDFEDGDLINSVVVDDSLVDYENAGVYTVTLKVLDSDYNYCESVMTVEVVLPVVDENEGSETEENDDSTIVEDETDTTDETEEDDNITDVEIIDKNPGDEDDDGDTDNTETDLDNVDETEDETENVEDVVDETEDGTEIVEDVVDETEDETEIIEDVTDETEDETEIIEDVTDETEDETENVEDVVDETEDETEIIEDVVDETEDETENVEDVTDETEDETENVEDVTDETGDETEIIEDDIDDVIIDDSEQICVDDENVEDVTDEIDDNTEIIGDEVDENVETSEEVDETEEQDEVAEETDETSEEEVQIEDEEKTSESENENATPEENEKTDEEDITVEKPITKPSSSVNGRTKKPLKNEQIVKINKGLKVINLDGEDDVVPYYIDENNKKQYIKFSNVIDGKLVFFDVDKEVQYEKVADKTFDDIASSWAKDSIKFVTSRNILIGINANEFSPNSEVTNAMIVTVFGRLFDNELEYTNNPNESITREELAVIINSYLQEAGQVSESEINQDSYGDETDISPLAITSVSNLRAIGIFNGDQNGNFNPKQNLTRAELSTVLERLIKYSINFEVNKM